MARSLKRQEELQNKRTSHVPPAGSPAVKQASALRPPRQSRSEESLAKMVLAGRDLIEQHANLDLVLINDVIRIAGTSIGAFYGRFRDKDTFVTAVLDAAISELQAEAENALWQNDAWAGGSASEITALVVDHYVDMCRRNQGLFKAILRHFAARAPDSNPMRHLHRHLQSVFVPALVRKMQPRTGVDAEAEIRMALQMVAGTLTLTVLTDPGPLGFEGDQLESKLTAMMQRFLYLP